MAKLPLAVTAILLFFCVISTVNGMSDVKSTNAFKRSSLTVAVDVERFDPSHCVTRILPNDWQDLPISPTPYPDLPSHNSIFFVQENLTQVRPDLTARQNGHRNSLRQRNPSRPPAKKHTYCEQVRSFAFRGVSGGFVRTKSAPVIENDSHYWFVWNTSHPINVAIWRSQGSDETYWTKPYTSPAGGDMRDAVQMEGGLASKFMRADLSLPYGIEGGVSGEIALFRFMTRPPG